MNAELTKDNVQLTITRAHLRFIGDTIFGISRNGSAIGPYQTDLRRDGSGIRSFC